MSRRSIVRLTGGCGSLPVRQAQAMYGLFVEALDGFEGGILFGGTRMLLAANPTKVRPSITEVPPLIRQYNPKTMLVGVVPVTAPPLELDIDLGLIISRDPRHITIVHPGQDFYLLLQASPDDGVIWDAEYKYCIEFVATLRQYALFNSVLIAYNGGKITEKEILVTARLGWPVILVDGAGGKSQRYARDKQFLAGHPNVCAVGPRPDELRQALALASIIDTAPGAKVIPLSHLRKDLA